MIIIVINFKEELYMSTVSLEEKIDKLLKLYKKQEAVTAVQNLISKMAYYYEAGMYEERYQCMALKTPGVSIEVGIRGGFDTPESIHYTMVETEKAFEKSHAEGMRKEFPDIEFTHDRQGFLETTLLGTPMIEVADDCETVKGCWSALMAVGKGYAHEPHPTARWVWWKYAADFIKEDGEWKVWHMQQSPLWTSEYNESWVEASLKMPPLAPPGTVMQGHGPGGMPWPKPDRPTSELYNSYRITTVPKLIPKLPEPYSTFDETFSY